VHIRVEGTIHTLSIYAYALAIFGYASAEIILNLKVLDGTRLVGSSRLSVLRVISVVAWMSAVYASGQYTFSVEFDQVPGTPRTYTAIGELETWAGGAAVIMNAYTWSDAQVDRLRAILVTQ